METNKYYKLEKVVVAKSEFKRTGIKEFVFDTPHIIVWGRTVVDDIHAYCFDRKNGYKIFSNGQIKFDPTGSSITVNTVATDFTFEYYHVKLDDVSDQNGNMSAFITDVPQGRSRCGRDCDVVVSAAPLVYGSAFIGNMSLLSCHWFSDIWFKSSKSMSQCLKIVVSNEDRKSMMALSTYQTECVFLKFFRNHSSPVLCNRGQITKYDNDEMETAPMFKIDKYIIEMGAVEFKEFMKTKKTDKSSLGAVWLAIDQFIEKKPIYEVYKYEIVKRV